MRMIAALLLLTTATAAAQDRHPCAGDAVARATPLLMLHLDDAELAKSIAVDASAKTLPAIKALKGDGRFDVLEVWAHVIKADYRLRFIYARIKGSCVLMGQEILEAGNPY